MTAGQRIRKIRVGKAMNLVTFAASLGMSRSYLNDIELDRTQPSREILIKLRQVHQISADFILFGQNDAAFPLSGFKIQCECGRVYQIIPSG